MPHTDPLHIQLLCHGKEVLSLQMRLPPFPALDLVGTDHKELAWLTKVFLHCPPILQCIGAGSMNGIGLG